MRHNVKDIKGTEIQGQKIVKEIGTESKKFNQKQNKRKSNVKGLLVTSIPIK